MVVFNQEEFVGDILSTTGFTYSEYRVNPGLPAVFPWLSAVAVNFSQYRLGTLEFIYRPTSGAAFDGTNNSLGTVFFRWANDPALSAQINPMGMQSASKTASTKPSSSLVYRVDLDGTGSFARRVRFGNVPTGSDPRMYDYGYLQVATDGMQEADLKVGKLYVRYTVELASPEPYGGVFSKGTLSAYYKNDSAQITQDLPLGHVGGWTDHSNGTMPLVFFSSVAGKYGGFNFPYGAGRYLVMLKYTGSLNSSTSTNMPNVTYGCVNQVMNEQNTTVASAKQCSALYIVDVVCPTGPHNNAPHIVWTSDNNTKIPQGNVIGEIWITQFNADTSGFV